MENTEGAVGWVSIFSRGPRVGQRVALWNCDTGEKRTGMYHRPEEDVWFTHWRELEP